MKTETVTEPLAWTLDGPPPKTVLVWPYLVFHWAIHSIMPVMRERYGTRFIIAVPNDSMAARYKDVITENDRIVYYPQVEELSQGPEEASDSEIERARAFEKKYGINYMRDVVQLDRGWFTRMSGMAPNTLIAKLKVPTLGRMVRSINGSFEWAEAIFREHPIDLFIGWPLAFQDACCTYVAEKAGVLITYTYPAKLENRAFWASGAFTTGFQHREAFARIKSYKAFDADTLRSPARPDKLAHNKVSDLYTTRRTLYEIARGVYEILFKIAYDIRHRRPFWRRRMNVFGVIETKLKIWRFFRRFVRMCEADLEALSARPFVFYAFHQEPEFTVQGQAKDFNDQAAIVRQIAKSLPAGVNLVIKEHVTLGQRHLSYYKDLLAFPNVLMAHPDIPGPEIVARARAVVSLRGTVTLEAGLLGKPALVFVPDTEFSVLSNTRVVPSLADLADCLAAATEPVPEATAQKYRDDAARFRAAVREISFPAPPLYALDGSLLDEVMAGRAVDLLVRLNNLHRRANRKAA